MRRKWKVCMMAIAGLTIIGLIGLKNPATTGTPKTETPAVAIVAFANNNVSHDVESAIAEFVPQGHGDAMLAPPNTLEAIAADVNKAVILSATAVCGDCHHQGTLAASPRENYFGMVGNATRDVIHDAATALVRANYSTDDYNDATTANANSSTTSPPKANSGKNVAIGNAGHTTKTPSTVSVAPAMKKMALSICSATCAAAG